MAKKRKQPKTLAPSVPLVDDISARADTYPGMASWAGGGPPGETCRTCVFWGALDPNHNYYAGGMIQSHQCVRAAVLMMIETPLVPHYAKACKEFKEAQAPPPAYKIRTGHK